MAQIRNEVRTELVDRTERLECNGEEMFVAIDLRLAAASAAEAARADDMPRQERTAVSVTVTYQVAQRPSRHGMRVRPIGRLLSYLGRPFEFFDRWETGLRQCTTYQIIYKMMALGATWLMFAG